MTQILHQPSKNWLKENEVELTKSLEQWPENIGQGVKLLQDIKTAALRLKAKEKGT